MTVIYYPSVEQGSDEWLALRCGALTAGDMGGLLTPYFRLSHSRRARSVMNRLWLERFMRVADPVPQSQEAERVRQDELAARQVYAAQCAPVWTVGLVTNGTGGFLLAHSPGGLIGDDGLLEIAVRRTRAAVAREAIWPEDHLRIQAALLASGRKWCDFVFFGGRQPMVTIRVAADAPAQAAIIAAGKRIETRLYKRMVAYRTTIAHLPRPESEPSMPESSAWFTQSSVTEASLLH